MSKGFTYFSRPCYPACAPLPQLTAAQQRRCNSIESESPFSGYVRGSVEPKCSQHRRNYRGLPGNPERGSGCAGLDWGGIPRSQLSNRKAH